jgi:hypothetical protein
MVDNADRKKVIKGRGVKRRQYEAKFETLEDPTIIVNVGWQNLPQPWSYTLCFSYVWWCHIHKNCPLSRHETHRKNNFTQYTNCLDEHMKACMLEVSMAMIGNHFFPKN